MNTSKHKATILQLIIKYGRITGANCLHISNANHYLGELYKAGILEAETIRIKGRANFKEWWIKDTPEAREKAKLYLEPNKKESIKNPKATKGKITS